jgi:hypothetical protein
MGDFDHRRHQYLQRRLKMGGVLRLIFWAFVAGAGFTVIASNASTVLSPFGMIAGAILLFAIVTATGMMRK